MMALTVAVLALVQDSPDLRWKADAERPFKCAWKMSVKAGNPEDPAKNVEMVQEHTAKATLVKTEKGIELRFQLTRSSVSGNVQGKPVENDSDFDVAGGYCARSVTRVKVTATREGKTLLTSDATMEFLMTPEKK